VKNQCARRGAVAETSKRRRAAKIGFALLGAAGLIAMWRNRAIMAVARENDTA